MLPTGDAEVLQIFNLIRRTTWGVNYNYSWGKFIKGGLHIAVSIYPHTFRCGKTGIGTCFWDTKTTIKTELDKRSTDWIQNVSKVADVIYTLA